MERERMLDKRKARDKETDDESTDSSKNPMKRPRVDYSSSPKEKSPSPASAQKSPLKSSSVADSLAAATPAQDKSGSGSNGDVALSPSKASGKNNGSSDEASMISNKFDLPPPLSKQELEMEIGKSEVIRDDSDSDNGSTKFLSNIIQSEEKKKRQGKGKGGSSTGSETGGGRNGTPVANAKRGSSQAKSNIKTEVKASHQPGLTSSPLSSDLSTVSSQSNYSGDLDVTIRINYPSSQTLFMDETVVRSDFATMEAFFRQHNMAFAPPSSQSLSIGGSSGYLGDASSVDNSAGHLQATARVVSNSNSRWTISSLGSTIPRNSIVSIATDKSDSPEDLMKRPGRPVSKARKRSDGPIMSSTKYDDNSRNSNSMDRMNVSPNPVSNGDEFPSPASSFAVTKSAKPQSPRVNPASASSPTKKLKGTPLNFSDRDEGLGTPSQNSTPGSSKNSRKTTKATPTTNTSNNSDSGRSTGGGKKPAVRRRVGSASNFPLTNVPGPVLNTPPPARSVAKIEGTVAKPISQFEQELNNEPVVEAELEKASTLWSSILPEELVFARWRDKSYYSGMVKSKGLNDTWIIDFDDGMEDVASESHIVPIRILGVGVKGIYSPDEKYDARSAEVIGQKFGKDPETNRQAVKYAIKIAGEPTPIWCSRRQLSIKETDAKKLRLEYQPPVSVKAGDVSLDNIVSGPRRRTRGGTESESSTSDSKQVAGALDTSSLDDNSGLTTPKSKPGPKAGKKTPASEAKKKRTTSATTVSTPLTKDASTSSPIKEVAEKKESPVKKDSPAKKKTVIEFGKKKTKKTLFQGIQFFLTASGGGDPGISGNPIIPPDPYDKDEIREQIENCGGEILDNVGSETVDDVFLISDSFARTVKYIYCMAATIPCVSHMWIKRCLELNEIVEWNVFKLPAGWSLEHQDLIQHHAKRPLKGCKVFVTSESDQLYNYWKPVLTAAEAILLKPPKKKGTLIPTGTEVVVTDNHSEFSADLLREAKALNLQVVKPEWLVQTIITGEKAHVFGHDRCKIYFEEESEDTQGEASASAEENCVDMGVLADFQSPD